MFFKIFSKEKKFLREVGAIFSPVLFSKLEEQKDKIEIYSAVKKTLQDNSIRLLGRSCQQTEKKWRGIGLSEMMSRIKAQEKNDPKSTFFLLVEIYARLLAKEEFEKFFRELLKDIPTEILDVIILKNPKLNLQFKDG